MPVGLHRTVPVIYEPTIQPNNLRLPAVIETEPIEITVAIHINYHYHALLELYPELLSEHDRVVDPQNQLVFLLEQVS